MSFEALKDNTTLGLVSEFSKEGGIMNSLKDAQIHLAQNNSFSTLAQETSRLDNHIGIYIMPDLAVMSNLYWVNSEEA